jgi:predicted nucleotidyltransferase
MNSFTRAAFGLAVARTLRHIPVVAVFVYGSVAAGVDHVGSDIDTFVLTPTEIADRHRLRVRADFHRLQKGLGYRPDPEFPVEVFGVTAVDAVLDTLDKAVAGGTFAALSEDGDEREILRALTGTRWVLQPGADLDRLTTRAQQLASRLGTEMPA